MYRKLFFSLPLLLAVAALLTVMAFPFSGQAVFVRPAGALFPAPPPPPTHSSGTMEIKGYVYGTNASCSSGCDSGTISVTVNTTTHSISYDLNSDPHSIASAIASAFNNDSNSPVTATATQGSNNPGWGGSDWLVTFTSKGTGSGVNYEVDTSVSSVTFGNVLYTDPSCCNPSQTLEVTPPPSFTGPAGTQDLTGFLSGGHS
jgi:hypothetical protein